MESFPGPTESVIKECGKMGSRKVQGSLRKKMGRLLKEYGKLGNIENKISKQ